jgi:hypothetical protein
MRVVTAIVLACLLGNIALGQEIDKLATRKKLWQEELELNPFAFQNKERGMISSLPYFTANCQLHIVLNASPQHYMQFDLINGKLLWTTDDISHRGGGGGFSYKNFVNMHLSRQNQVDSEPKAAVLIVKGIETNGHYTAVIDRDTGQVLAHKIHGTGFYGDRPIKGDPREGIFMHAELRR